MKIKDLPRYIKLLKLQKQKNYHAFVKNYDAAKFLADEPLCVMDKGYNNTELTATDFDNILAKTELYEKLAKKYNLHEIAFGKTDFERAVNLLNWLTKNTFYNGAQLSSQTDSSLDILDNSFGKSFKNAINCRSKAIVYADCLVSVGIKAYPVCMISSGFKEGCHFTCHVYISDSDKWCAFDPSFGCWFTDKSGNMIDLFEIRNMFIAGEIPVVNGYNFNGTTECIDIYTDCFLKLCLSNLSTWNDNSMERRTGKKWKHKKKFQSKIPS